MAQEGEGRRHPRAAHACRHHDDLRGMGRQLDAAPDVADRLARTIGAIQFLRDHPYVFRYAQAVYELARDKQPLTDEAVAGIVGVEHTTVWRWRRALGIE